MEVKGKKVGFSHSALCVDDEGRNGDTFIALLSPPRKVLIKLAFSLQTDRN